MLGATMKEFERTLVRPSVFLPLSLSFLSLTSFQSIFRGILHSHACEPLQKLDTVIWGNGLLLSFTIVLSGFVALIATDG